ncbi:hypothetical protein [Micromonospora avicenniae]|uniref:hypothetical protein n=1 Tax=Micromonospora avicenniae TaxID=1198245 RepID=UPI00343556A4
MSIIDLGELRDDPGPYVRASRPRRRAARRPLWTALASLLVLTLLTLVCRRTDGASFGVWWWSV